MSQSETGGLPPPRPIIDAPWLRQFMGGTLLFGLVRLVERTSRISYDPPDFLTQAAAREPAIYVAWHANVLATPMMVPDARRLSVMTSPHPDGRMASALAEALGMTPVKATGKTERMPNETGSLTGFRTMLRTLKSGQSIFMHAEVPPVPGRLVARGIGALSRMSGCPVIPVALASSRRIVIEHLWDKMQINLPFSRVAVVAGEIMEPPATAEAEDEALARLKQTLDRAYATAMERATRR